MDFKMDSKKWFAIIMLILGLIFVAFMLYKQLSPVDDTKFKDAEVTTEKKFSGFHGDDNDEYEDGNMVYDTDFIYNPDFKMKGLSEEQLKAINNDMDGLSKAMQEYIYYYLSVSTYENGSPITGFDYAEFYDEQEDYKNFGEIIYVWKVQPADIFVGSYYNIEKKTWHIQML